ncbi:MAG: Rne/Rng family ribonuclease [bacterium]|nr:Rne/Rng family ribonuclease [bacterium]
MKLLNLQDGFISLLKDLRSMIKTGIGFDDMSKIKVKREIFINVGQKDTRVALRENGRLCEIFWEKRETGRLVGSVYKGKISRVIPGIQAAFVDIGLEKNAYLSLSDAGFLGDDSDGEIEKISASRADKSGPFNSSLKRNQEVLVQIAKEPLGEKGARITTHIALPGRYLVFMPTEDHVGISRKIESEEERTRLRKLVKEIKPQGKGIIIRTVAGKRSKKDLSSDVQFLSKLWDKIQKTSNSVRAPSLIHQDLGIIFRVIRDLMSFDVVKLVIDSHSEYEEIMEFVSYIQPNLKSRVEFYQGQEPLFSFYGIEHEIYEALNRSVKLKCGGHIVIDETEALVSIDVNSGKFIGKKDLEETALKTNLEAAVEIAKQMRLRDLGGIIVVDFIDMEREENKGKVLATFREALKSDRSRTNVVAYGKLGLVEMTRKRSRPSLEKLLGEVCPCCRGEGIVRPVAVIAGEVFNEIKHKKYDQFTNRILVKVHNSVAIYILREAISEVRYLEKLLNRDIFIKADKDINMENYEIIQQKEVKFYEKGSN